MKKVPIDGLIEALAFIEKHGGPDKKVRGWSIPDYMPPSGAYGDAGEYIMLKDGSIFGVEAFTNGPLSEVTPDEDFGVKILGWEV